MSEKNIKYSEELAAKDREINKLNKIIIDSNISKSDSKKQNSNANIHVYAKFLIDVA